MDSLARCGYHFSLPPVQIQVQRGGRPQYQDGDEAQDGNGESGVTGPERATRYHCVDEYKRQGNLIPITAIATRRPLRAQMRRRIPLQQLSKRAVDSLERMAYPEAMRARVRPDSPIATSIKSDRLPAVMTMERPSTRSNGGDHPSGGHNRSYIYVLTLRRPLIFRTGLLLS